MKVTKLAGWGSLGADDVSCSLSLLVTGGRTDKLRGKSEEWQSGDRAERGKREEGTFGASLGGEEAERCAMGVVRDGGWPGKRVQGCASSPSMRGIREN